MDENFLNRETVTLELEDQVVDAIEEKAFRDHRGNRDAGIRDLLDEWLKHRHDE